jgi:hypothetical protein
MDLAVQQRKRNLENKVPELKKALAVVELLHAKQEVGAAALVVSSFQTTVR